MPRSSDHGGTRHTPITLTHPSLQAATQLSAEAQIAANTGTLQPPLGSASMFMSPQQRLAAFQLRRSPNGCVSTHCGVRELLWCA